MKMSAWIEKFINVNQFSRSGKKLNTVNKIVVHYTANPGASAENHYRYFNTLKDRYASAHIFVDKAEAINIIPLGEVAYHAGDIQKHNADGTPYRGVKELLPSANYLSIGVEMCIEKDGTFHPDTITRTEDVFVELCKKFNLNPMCDIVRHFDVTAKNCPAPWVKDEQQFAQFKQRVNAKLNPPKPVEVVTPVQPKPTTLYRVRKTWADVKSQIGAYGDLQNAIDLAKKNVGYEVYDSTGKQVYPVASAVVITTVVVKPKPTYPNKLYKVQSPLLHDNNVKLIQEQLNKFFGKQVVKVDSFYGNDTAKWIGEFQHKKGLVADKIVGQTTWNTLFI
jgi:N-acetylmuramoyl-L-alanine amidase